MLFPAAFRACRRSHQAHDKLDFIRAQHAFGCLANTLHLRDVDDDVARRKPQETLQRYGAHSGASAS